MKPIPLLIAFLLTFATTQAQTVIEKTDSTLLAYYQWCSSHRQDPVVLLKADTMLQIATRKQDDRMQCVALTLKADYYYFTNQIDSFKLWIPRIQEFARQKGQLKYYYFVWTRLILYYTKQSQYTLAQYELEHYLAQSRTDDYKPATADAYVQLAHIYRTRALLRPASDYYRQAIDYIEQNDLDKFQLPSYYSGLAFTLIALKEYAEAAQVIEKGKTQLALPEHIRPLLVQQARLYIETGKLDQAWKLFNELTSKNPDDPARTDIPELEIRLLKASGQNEKALTAIDALVNSYKRQGYNERFFYELFKSRAEVLAEMGLGMSAYDQLRHYNTVSMQKITDENQSSLGEFATLLDVARLNSEKIQLQQQAQAERLHRTYLIITALGIILALAAAFIFLQIRTNRRLAHAKRAAEEANRMKGIFIRNITHEINTPLNAIVGFSELASTAVTDNEERQTYIGIIQENSGYLQKLVDDVLYISDVESSDTSPELGQVDINRCCHQAIDKVATFCSDNSGILFEPGCEKLTAHTSQLLIAKVLSELLINAIRFAPGNPVTLAYTAEKKRITFTVTDCGPGVQAIDAERIFERFVKLDTFTQGMGLGLGVCRLLARALGGKIYLDTTYTGGARFVFTVPAQ